MTEDEAKQKMCPHFASAALQTPGMGRLEQDEIVTAMRCKGSDCMMWRWDTGTDEPFFRWIPQLSVEQNEAGYCGLGGKP